MNSKELEVRLIEFSIQVVNLIKTLPEDRITNHLAGQLLRSSTSPALIMEKLKEQNQKRILFINWELC